MDCWESMEEEELLFCWSWRKLGDDLVALAPCRPTPPPPFTCSREDCLGSAAPLPPPTGPLPSLCTPLTTTEGGPGLVRPGTRTPADPGRPGPLEAGTSMKTPETELLRLSAPGGGASPPEVCWSGRFTRGSALLARSCLVGFPDPPLPWEELRRLAAAAILRADPRLTGGYRGCSLPSASSCRSLHTIKDNDNNNDNYH